MNSNFLKLNLSDLLKGLVLAVITAVLTGVANMISNGGDFTKLDWKSIGGIAITAGLSYLLKNLVQNSDGQLLKKETPGAYDKVAQNIDPTKLSQN